MKDSNRSINSTEMKKMTLSILVLVLLCAILLNYFMLVEGFFSSSSTTQFSDKVQALLTQNVNGGSMSSSGTASTNTSTGSTIGSTTGSASGSASNPNNPKEVSQCSVMSQYQQLRNLLKADIQDAVKNEVLNQRALIPPIKCRTSETTLENSNKSSESSGSSSSSSSSGASASTPSLWQGSWFRGGSKDPSKPAGANCPYAQGQQSNQPEPVPGIDMSQYIRKDSIPCYGCKLP